MNTVSVIVTAISGFVISSVIGMFLIPFLRRLHFGQTILEEGPAWQKKKQGTPTMGGFMFIIATIVASLLGYMTMYLAGEVGQANTIGTWYMISAIVMALCFGALGFVDDFVKVAKKRNLGLTAMQKILAQLLIAVVYLLVQRQFDPITTIFIPFMGEFDIGLFYYPLMIFIIVGVANAVNLTDGIDGLNGSVTFVAAMAFMLIAAVLRAAEINILAAAVAGSCLGFLVWNFHPAKVFMGDTGSMFLGGIVAGLALGLRIPILLVFIGIIYMVETLSDIIQITSFKLTGKRVFKMAPIHHHFEMCGWSEVKIVGVFSLVTVIGCAIAFVAVLLK